MSAGREQAIARRNSFISEQSSDIAEQADGRDGVSESPGNDADVKAQQGLADCWGGFNRVVLTEARIGYFSVRLWNSSDLVQAIYRTYERLPAEVQAELPLKREWMLVVEESET